MKGWSIMKSMGGVSSESIRFVMTAKTKTTIKTSGTIFDWKLKPKQPWRSQEGEENDLFITYYLRCRNPTQINDPHFGFNVKGKWMIDFECEIERWI